MTVPRINFGQLPTGSRVAYAETGEGPPLVMLPGWLSHVEKLWSHPSASSALAKLSASHRFVWYDRLGCGLSDRTGFTPSVENDVDQLVAVLSAAEIERCSLIGYSWGGPAASVFASRHPERVDRLVLLATYARGAAIASPEQHAAFSALIRSNWNLATITLATVFVPNANAMDLRWFSRFQRDAATADTAVELLEEMRRHDVREQLTEIAVPTLVLTNRNDPVVDASNAREIADLIPRSTLHVLEGNEHEPFIRDSGRIVETILEFVEDRPLTTARTTRRPEVRVALTGRETEVLGLLAGGAANKAIAKELQIRVSTVERHVANIYRKLDARGRADAAIAAVGLGLVQVR